MGIITTLIFFFLFSLSFGVGLFAPLAPTKYTGADFFRICLRVTFVTGILSMAIYLTHDFPFGLFAICLSTALILSVIQYVFHKDEKSKLMWILWLVTQFFYLLAFKDIFYLVYKLDLSILVKTHLISSTLFLGVITYAMILGHWYLVTPKLSEKPLKYASYIIWFLFIIKFATSLSGYLSFSPYFEAGTHLGEGYMFNWILVSMRALWGYVILGIMSFYTYKLICMRSIQSATGVLYVMTFFVFIGELLSTYLIFKHGIYI